MNDVVTEAIPKNQNQENKDMKYGKFDDINREYVIQRPDTPYPWINYLGTSDFFSIISNTAGGYSFYRDARLRRITRYRYNNVPIDDGGKYFYINDGSTVWSPGWKPVKTKLDNYECRHGMGYSRFNSELNGLRAEALFFIPLNENVEIQQLTLTNRHTQTKTMKVFSLVEWCLWNALDDMTNFQRNYSTGEVEVRNSVLLHKTEYKERRNHYAYYACTTEVDGFDTDRDTFLGMYNGFEAPQSVLNGKAQNSIAHGWSPIASHMIEITLEPGESKSLTFLLGYEENEFSDKFNPDGKLNASKAEATINKFSNPKAIANAFNELKEYWNNLLSHFQVNSSDPKLNRMVNIWNQYQNMITYLFSRSASYFESGIGRGMGFRDSNQDLIGVSHMIPQLARERILDIAATQKEDGSAFHQYQPLTKRGNPDIGSHFNDDPLWLILAVSNYLKETGNWSILDEKVPFDNDKSKSESLFEHLKRSFYHVVNNLGPHQLPLIGRADWNDCLNLNCFSETPDESFQTTENEKGLIAESLMIAGMFVLYGKEFVQICQHLSKDTEASDALVHIKNMQHAIDKHGWDGNWFLRAYDSFGRKIGSHENKEGKIFIESQGFCIMAGIGIDDNRAQKALKAVNEMLACEYGIVLLNPAFTKYYVEYGEISTYPKGYKENAGIFCHNNPWIIIAEAMTGNSNQAFDYYKRIAPAYLDDIVELHKTEPYVYSQMIAGKDAAKPGEAKNSWLTGTAAWNFYAATQYLLGIRPEYDGLRIAPCLPKEFDRLKITRKFRGATYNIQIERTGSKSLYVNNKQMNGDIIPVFPANTEHQIKVTI